MITHTLNSPVQSGIIKTDNSSKKSHFFQPKIMIPALLVITTLGAIIGAGVAASLGGLAFIGALGGVSLAAGVFGAIVFIALNKQQNKRDEILEENKQTLIAQIDADNVRVKKNKELSHQADIVILEIKDVLNKRDSLQRRLNDLSETDPSYAATKDQINKFQNQAEQLQSSLKAIRKEYTFIS